MAGTEPVLGWAVADLEIVGDRRPRPTRTRPRPAQLAPNRIARAASTAPEPEKQDDPSSSMLIPMHEHRAFVRACHLLDPLDPSHTRPPPRHSTRCPAVSVSSHTHAPVTWLDRNPLKHIGMLVSIFVSVCYRPTDYSSLAFPLRTVAGEWFSAPRGCWRCR